MNAGKPKPLLPLAGRPMLRWCCEALLDGGVERIVVVQAPGAALEEALGGLPVSLVVNARPGSEMADSLAAGLCAANGAASGFLVCLADHPFVSAATIRALARAHRERPGAIHVPVCRGRRGHPSLFPAGVAREVGPGRTLRDVREAHRELVEEVAVDDDGVLFDVDTPGDYRLALARVGPPARRACVAVVRHG